jgi:hypothetical protein
MPSAAGGLLRGLGQQPVMRPANPDEGGSGILARLFRALPEERKENAAFSQLALHGDRQAAADPRSTAELLQAGDPMKQGVIRLYSGGNGTFWTRVPERAASYGPVRSVEVPQHVFDAGRAQAAKLGQPAPYDTVLPPEWVNRATAAPNIKPVVHEVAAESDSAVDALLKSLGVVRR